MKYETLPSDSRLLTTAPAVVANAYALLVVLGAVHLGPQLVTEGLVVAVTFGGVLWITSLRTRPILRCRLAAGFILAALVLASLLPRLPSVFENRAYAALPSGSITAMDVRVLDDLRPGASSWMRLSVAPETVYGAGGFRGSGGGRLALLWEGPAYLADEQGGSVLPIRGDTLRIRGLSGIPTDEEGAIFSTHEALMLVPQSSGSGTTRRSIRREIRERLARLPRRTRGLAGALSLGDRGDLPSDFIDDVRRSGASHVLALSGMHLAVLAGILVALIGKIVPNHIRLIVILPVLIAYVWVAGWIPSLVRAVLLVSFTAVARSMRRRVPAPVLLSRTILAAIVLAPRVVTEIGFLLSVAALAGLMLFTQPIANHLGRTIPRPVAIYIAASAAAILGTGPLSLAVFGELYPAGLVLAGLVSIIIVGVAWTVVLFLFLARIPYLGTACAVILDYAMVVLEKIANLGGKIPAASGYTAILLLVVIALPVLPSLRRTPIPAYESRLDF